MFCVLKLYDFVLIFICISQLVTALTNIKPVNKTDAVTLLQEFKTLANIIKSKEERLSQCSGLGPRKAKKLYQIFNEPFMKEK